MGEQHSKKKHSTIVSDTFKDLLAVLVKLVIHKSHFNQNWKILQLFMKILKHLSFIKAKLKV